MNNSIRRHETVKHRKDGVERTIFRAESEEPCSGGSCDVSFGMGATIKIAEFEMIRLDVGIKLPCKPSMADDAYDAALAWVEERLKRQVKRFRRGVDLGE